VKGSSQVKGISNANRLAKVNPEHPVSEDKDHYPK
jgi:hypothetical protein